MPPEPEDLPAPSALPSPRARLLAFIAILIAGTCGALIGYGVVDVQCGRTSLPPAEFRADGEGQPPPAGDCGTAIGLGMVAGGMLGAGGVAVIVVLVLRAMGEWRARELPPAR